MTGQDKPLESWDGFCGSNFLSSDDVKGEDHAFVVIKVDMDRDNDRPMLDLESSEKKYMMSLNVTNSNFLKDAGIKTPKELVGKKLFFRKTMAFSPKQKKDVPTLRINKVE